MPDFRLIIPSGTQPVVCRSASPCIVWMLDLAIALAVLRVIPNIRQAPSRSARAVVQAKVNVWRASFCACNRGNTISRKSNEEVFD